MAHECMIEGMKDKCGEGLDFVVTDVSVQTVIKLL